MDRPSAGGPARPEMKCPTGLPSPLCGDDVETGRLREEAPGWQEAGRDDSGRNVFAARRLRESRKRHVRESKDHRSEPRRSREGTGGEDEASHRIPAALVAGMRLFAPVDRPPLRTLLQPSPPPP